MREALAGVVRYYDYRYLDKGIGTETEIGRVWIAARRALEGAKGI